MWWLFHIPSPGKAIGALAVVAGIMSVREMKVLGKISWVFLLVCMLVTEFKAINKDREENEVKQAAFFKEQKDGFQNVTDQAKRHFGETTGELKAAIQALNETLGIATGTFQQTQPHAAILPTTFTITNSPTPPALFDSNTVYSINFFHANNGSEQGMITKRIGRIYVAKPDDSDAQKEISKKFAQAWREAESTKDPPVVLSGSPGFWTESQSISKEDENNLKFHGNTLYFVRRIEYTDKTGKWWSDRCENLQIEGTKLDLDIVHPCGTLMNGRYRAKRQ